MFTQRPIFFQNFQSDYSLAEQKDILSGLNFYPANAYLDPETEDFSMEDSRILRFHKTFSFDGINTVSTLDMDTDTQSYLENREGIYLQVKLLSAMLERSCHLANWDTETPTQTVEADIVGLFNISTQASLEKSVSGKKIIPPLSNASNIYIMKTHLGVSYHIEMCGEMKREEFFEALKLTDNLSNYYDLFYLEAEKMELDTNTPKNHQTRALHKI